MWSSSRKIDLDLPVTMVSLLLEWATRALCVPPYTVSKISTTLWICTVLTRVRLMHLTVPWQWPFVEFVEKFLSHAVVNHGLLAPSRQHSNYSKIFSIRPVWPQLWWKNMFHSIELSKDGVSHLFSLLSRLTLLLYMDDLNYNIEKLWHHFQFFPLPESDCT